MVGLQGLVAWKTWRVEEWSGAAQEVGVREWEGGERERSERRRRKGKEVDMAVEGSESGGLWEWWE